MDLAAAPPRPEPIADSPPALADEGLVLRRAARAAEDTGNVVGARRLVRLLPVDAEQRCWLRSLDEAVALGPDPEPGRLAVWLLQPALRHGLGTLRAGAVRLLAHEVKRARGSGSDHRAAGHADSRSSSVETFSNPVLDDPLLADAALFDAGLLAAYLESALHPALLARAAPIADWPAAAGSVFELTERDGVTLARDQRDDHKVLLASNPADPPTSKPPAASPVPALVYGRPVPWPEEPGARFVLPPIPLDRITARRVLRAITRRAPVEERVRAVAAHQRRSSTGPGGA